LTKKIECEQIKKEMKQISMNQHGRKKPIPFPVMPNPICVESQPILEIPFSFQKIQERNAEDACKKEFPDHATRF
jgi:hypothetical protein